MILIKYTDGRAVPLSAAAVNLFFSTVKYNQFVVIVLTCASILFYGWGLKVKVRLLSAVGLALSFFLLAWLEFDQSAELHECVDKLMRALATWEARHSDGGKAVLELGEFDFAEMPLLTRMISSVAFAACISCIGWTGYAVVIHFDLGSKPLRPFFEPPLLLILIPESCVLTLVAMHGFIYVHAYPLHMLIDACYALRFILTINPSFVFVFCQAYALYTLRYIPYKTGKPRPEAGVAFGIPDTLNLGILLGYAASIRGEVLGMSPARVLAELVWTVFVCHATAFCALAAAVRACVLLLKLRADAAAAVLAEKKARELEGEKLDV